LQYVSPLKNTAGPVFSVKIREPLEKKPCSNAVVLENVQDPGNVGTILRTANALGIGRVLLLGDCADVYNPKTVRSSMGAVFRQPIEEIDPDGLKVFLQENGLALYGAALSDGSKDIREIEMQGLAVAIGSEGAGLSAELLALCGGQLIIPMERGCESLNAAVAASIVMWEIYKKREC
jgi:TrmH family RNA methyltransferase